MADITTQQVMDNMCKAFLPDKAAGLNAVIQYHLTGNDGGDYVVTIENGKCSVATGSTSNPTMTMTTDAQDYKDIITGKTNAMNAFMQGKVKLAGDLGLAMKLPNLFKMS